MARRGLLAVALIVVGVVVGGAAAAWLLPSQIDPARLRETIAVAAAERLGATVTIDGPVRLALLPRPVLVASRVSVLHGAPGDPDALAVTADLLTVRLDLSALLHGHLAAADLALTGAEVQVALPFDIRVLTAGRPASLRSTTILLQNSRILVGPFAIEQVDGQFVADRLTGDVALSGSFRRHSGTAWRGSLRLTRPGGDGSAALDATLDEIYSARGLTAKLAGQLAGNGDLNGHFSVAGPDLGHLLPAPAAPFTASGRATLSGGIAAVEDVALTLDAVPSRLDATWRFGPQPRLDVRLAASRLDLDAWRRAAEAATAGSWPELPVALDLSSESASLAGGTLRQLRAALELDGGRLTVRSAEAVLPGDMAVQAAGAIDFAATTSRLDWRLDGADLPATAAWLAGLAGWPASIPVPRDIRSLAGRATVETSGNELEAHEIAASLDGVGLHGEAVAGWPAPGRSARPNLAAILTVDRLDVARWLAWWRDSFAVSSWAALDGSLKLTTPHASLPGMAAALDGDMRLRNGELEVRRLAATTPGWHAEASGVRSAAGLWSSVAVSLAADRADSLAAILPLRWADALAAFPAILQQPLQASVRGSGTPAAPSGSVQADLGALHVEGAIRADAQPGRFGGELALRHPNARALAQLLGYPAGFLGEGGLAVASDVAVDGVTATAGDLHMRAGTLDATAALRLDGLGAVPALTGSLAASMLPLPGVQWRSTTPLSLSLLHGWNAVLDVHAARAEGPGIRLADARARVSLAAGVLDLTNLSAKLPAGGQVIGRLGIATDVVPPRATADLAFAAARLGAQPWHPFDLLASNVSGTLRMEAHGFAPAALLATARGEARASSASASLVGVDVGGLGGTLSDAAVRAALAGGRTLLDSVNVALTLDQGLASLTAEAVASGGARLAASGTIDLPDATVDLAFSVKPAITDPPRIEWRLSGPADNAVAVPALGGLAKWRSAHQ